MRKALLLLVALLLLAGCSNNQAGAPAQYNKAGTKSVSIDDVSKPNPSTSNAAPAPAGPSNSDSSGAAAGAKTDVIEIKEKMFIAQTNDVYLNPDEYLGKTIKYEGIFDIYNYEEANITYYSVIRYGPGCCGNDAYAGFEVVWGGVYPKQNDWVEAVGVLESYEEEGSEYLRLRLTSLKVLETRGAEYVSQ